MTTKKKDEPGLARQLVKRVIQGTNPVEDTTAPLPPGVLVLDEENVPRKGDSLPHALHKLGRAKRDELVGIALDHVHGKDVNLELLANLGFDEGIVHEVVALQRAGKRFREALIELGDVLSNRKALEAEFLAAQAAVEAHARRASEVGGGRLAHDPDWNVEKARLRAAYREKALALRAAGEKREAADRARAALDAIQAALATFIELGPARDGVRMSEARPFTTSSDWDA